MSTDLRFLGCAGVVRVPCVSLLGGAVPQVEWPAATAPSTPLPTATEPPRPMSRGCPGSMHTVGLASTILLCSSVT